MTLESGLEQSVCHYVKACHGRAFKFVSPGTPGIPDRICIFPGGAVIFVELKRPGVKDGRSPRQIKMQKVLTDLGCECWRVNNLQYFKERLHDLGIQP